MSPRLTYGSIDLTDHPYMIEFGYDTGAPQNVTEALAFLLQDGEIEMTERTSNRTIQFNVIIEGSDMAELADFEAALMLEANKVRNLLTIDPGDGFGPATVYETYRAQVTWLRDDNHEINGFRRYSVTIKAMPAGRSANEVVATALAASGTTTTLVNNGSATTNWTGDVNGVSTSPSVVSGAVKVTNGSAVGGVVTCSLIYTASITTSSTKYLVVDWKPESTTGDPDLRAFADGIELTKVAQNTSPTPGFTRSWFYVAASSIAVLRLDSTSDIPSAWVGTQPASVRSLYVDNVNRSDVKPTLGTARQLLRSVDVAGTARTQGSLAIEHETSALGDVLAYAYPDSPDVLGYSPPLGQNQVSGPTITPDSSLVSGGSADLTAGTVTFDIPVRNLPPGAFTLMVRTTTGGTITPCTLQWTAKTRINSTDVGPTLSGSTNVIQSGSSAYLIWAVTRLMLPTVDVDSVSSTAVVRVTLTATAFAAVTFDEAWLFSSIGQLAQVACGAGTASSGGPARRLFIEPATAIRPRPTIRIGHASDRSDARYPSGSAAVYWQLFQFIPTRVNIFTVTTNALDAAVTLRHYPRWELNAAS